MIEERRFTGYADIIPFGVDLLLLSSGLGDNANKFIIVARPDGDFKTADEAFDRAMELDGPKWILNFEDIASINNLIKQLQATKKLMKECGFT